MVLDITKFKNLLIDNLLTQGELAKLSGISQSTISALLKGKNNIGMSSIRGLIEVFGKDAVRGIIKRD